MVVIALVAAWFFIPNRPEIPWQREPAPAAKPEPPATRVVKDRPGGARHTAGATINEAEAIRLLRRHLVNNGKVTNDCLAILSNGSRAATYRLTAYNRCDNTRLGRWAVDGKTRAIAPAVH